jgi:hypothetical protein
MSGAVFGLVCASGAADASTSGTPRIAGCALFPSNNAWRQDVSHAKVSLKKYGMFVADNGGNWFVSGTGHTWNDPDLDQLKKVPGSAFEAVATGSIRH